MCQKLCRIEKRGADSGSNPPLSAIFILNLSVESREIGETGLNRLCQKLCQVSVVKYFLTTPDIQLVTNCHHLNRATIKDFLVVRFSGFTPCCNANINKMGKGFLLRNRFP